ncbi:MAG: MtrB/PioB family outer membrane beta-barrel protein [Burkholderiales bacterium]|nr:MtrB/PioB family outer membrane beta-barrel protein [Burkholderiales bacterium]
MRQASRACPLARHSTAAQRFATQVPRLARLPALVGLVLAQGLLAPVWADSGVGADTIMANTLTPRGRMPALERDEDGRGVTEHSRSPTGFLHGEPTVKPEWSKGQASDWLTRGGLEVGGLHISGDRKAAKFGEYQSTKQGLVLSNVWLEAERPDAALFFDLDAGSIGRHDQYMRASGGRYNAWRITGFYNETDHLFTSRYRNLWSGTGTDYLSLNPPLTAGPGAPTTGAQMGQLIGDTTLATPYSSLSVLRQKGGLRLDMRIDEGLRAFASVTSEKREGARPFGMLMGAFGGNGNMDIPESIDYDTHDLVAGLQWNRGLTSVNLQASASLFRNNVSTLTVENPMVINPANGLTRYPVGVFDLYPDNDAYNLKAEFAHAIPEWSRARFTALLSATRMRQNDDLIPYTTLPGAVVNGVAGGGWDTTASLSQKSAHARIDTRLADLGVALSPVDALDVKAKLRYYDTDNDSSYWACNPLTGQWGRLVNNGSFSSFATANIAPGVNPPGTAADAFDRMMCNLEAVRAMGLVPASGSVNIGSVPYAYKQTNAGVSADYRVGKGQNLSLAYERETFRREHRERAKTWEDRVKLGYVNRALTGGTLRVSLEQDRRRGSTYISDPYEEFFSASMGPLPTTTGSNMTSWIHVNDLHRKFDLADRDQMVLNLRYNHALRDDLDLMLSAQAKDQKYPSSAYGRSGHQRQNTLTLDLNWQPSAKTSVYGYLATQRSTMFQRNNHQNACVLGSTYYFYSDGSISTTPTPTPAQAAAGITVVGNSGQVTAANFATLCATASPTSPLFPTSRDWTASQKDRSNSVGIGAQHDFGRVLVDVNANYTRGRTGVSYTYDPVAMGRLTSGAPTPAQQTTVALIGSGFPDMIYEQRAIDASFVMPMTKNTKLRLLLRHEAGKIRDWHYDGVADNPAPTPPAQQIYLDAGPQRYDATMIGAFLQLSW